MAQAQQNLPHQGLSSQPDPLEWHFVQSFGDDNSSDDDLVTAIEFDSTGDFLAGGDKAGRICIFEGHVDAKQQGKGKRVPIEYKFYTEFQSHEPEFDCLKSLEIEEKINMIRWHKRQQNGLFLLATNDKTIKFWKVHEKKQRQLAPPPSIANGLPNSSPFNNSNIYIPKLVAPRTVTTATPKRVYANAHSFHINSISINSDGETFISADDLRVNLWHLEIANECFNIVDLKPPNLEELTEVITSACFHPTSCNILLYSSSRGSIRLGDLRGSALCDQHSKLFEIEEDPASKNFFSEIISSISDAKFTADGRYIMSRDYLTVKVWDVNMESRPLFTIPVHDYLRGHLSDLYENDCIFDKFEIAPSPDGLKFLTGSYNNNFVLHNVDEKKSITIEALKDPPRPQSVIRKKPPAKDEKKSDPKKPPAERKDKKLQAMDTDVPNISAIDFGKKALHVAWHPKADCVAVAGLNKLYLYQMT